MPWACAVRNWVHVGPARRGAGPTPALARITQIVLGASRYPSPASSPWMRRHPQVGLSRASRNTNSRTCAVTGGRPGVRLGYVHRRAIRARCHRNRVAGATKNAAHRPRGNSFDNPANTARSAGSRSSRRTCRRSTATWCRSTSTSTALARSPRATRIISCRTWRSIR